MDALASIGRGYSTIQFFIAIIISTGLIGGGLYLALTPAPSTQVPGIPPLVPGGPSVPGTTIPGSSTGRVAGGISMIIFGIVFMFSSWIRRKLIRSNPTIASIAGAIDVVQLLKV